MAVVLEFEGSALVSKMYMGPEKKRFPLAVKAKGEVKYSGPAKNGQPESIFTVSFVDGEHIRVVNSADPFSQYIVWKRGVVNPAQGYSDTQKALEEFKLAAPRIGDILAKGQSKEAKWTDEALLHDGRKLDVQRTVAFYKDSPVEHSLQARNPDTGREMSWKGERHVRPLLLEFFQGTAYLAVTSAMNLFQNPPLYGCPDVPFVFFKYDEKKAVWERPAPLSIPPEVTKANLSEDYDSFWMPRKPRQTPDDIQRRYAELGRQTERMLSADLPRHFEDWKYAKKARYRNERYQGDCRPPVPIPVDAINPETGPRSVSWNIGLEVLNVKDFTPPIHMDSTSGKPEWGLLAFDKERGKACDAFFKPADPNNPKLDGWKSFVQDKTGKKLIGWLGPSVCDPDALWFIYYGVESERCVISKVNPQGEVIYRISFEHPEQVRGDSGSIAAPTLKAREGWVYFDWLYFRRDRDTVLLSRTVSVRFKEP